MFTFSIFEKNQLCLQLLVKCIILIYTLKILMWNMEKHDKRMFSKRLTHSQVFCNALKVEKCLSEMEIKIFRRFPIRTTCNRPKYQEHLHSPIKPWKRKWWFLYSRFTLLNAFSSNGNWTRSLVITTKIFEIEYRKHEQSSI